MPDASGRFQGITVPTLPWVEDKPKPSPEVARPGEWVEVTCKNDDCPEVEEFTTDVAESVYDVLPPPCPRCGVEQQAV